MKSKEVTDQIPEIVAKASAAGASIASLKGQLDNYSLFYEGLKTYTSAVSDAASGANTIKLNMTTLYDNVGLLKTAVGDLNDGTKTLYDGVQKLKDGVDTFANRTSGLKNEVKDIIDNMMASAIGSKISIGSFVSEDNVNVLGVQFVIKTEAVVPEVAPVTLPPEEKPKNFWQKLLALFGIKS
jgi:X-X-X-Leu-X-X-Gly heptad repeat protein